MEDQYMKIFIKIMNSRSQPSFTFAVVELQHLRCIHTYLFSSGISNPNIVLRFYEIKINLNTNLMCVFSMKRFKLSKSGINTI